MITDTVIVFSDEDHARRGLGMLKALQAEGILALYGSAVVVKEPTGHLSVQAAEGGPFGMTVGGISGLLAGLLAGPLGAAIGAAGTRRMRRSTGARLPSKCRGRWLPAAARLWRRSPSLGMRGWKSVCAP